MRPSDLRGIRWNDLRLGDDGALMWRLPYSKGNKTGDRVQILRLEPTTEPWCPVTALRRLADSLREARSAGWLGTTAQPDSDGIVRRVFPNDIGHDTIRVLLRPAGVDVRCQDFRYRKAAKVWAETARHADGARRAVPPARRATRPATCSAGCRRPCAQNSTHYRASSPPSNSVHTPLSEYVVDRHR